MKKAYVLLGLLGVAGAVFVGFQLYTKDVISTTTTDAENKTASTTVTNSSTTPATTKNVSTVSNTEVTQTDPVIFVKDLYRWYLGEISNRTYPIGGVEFEKRVTKRFVDAIEEKMQQEETGSDPVLLAQDYGDRWAQDMEVSVVSQNNTQAQLTVNFTNPAHTIKVGLVWNEGTWKLDSVNYEDAYTFIGKVGRPCGDGSLTLLSEEGKCMEISVTTINRTDLNLEVQSCGELGTQECFGSVASGWVTRNSVSVSDLISTGCQMSLGLSDGNEEYVVIAEGVYCSDDLGEDIYAEFKENLLSKAPDLIELYEYFLVDMYGPCYGIEDGQCRE